MRTPKNTPTCEMSKVCAAFLVLCRETFYGCQDALVQRYGAKARGRAAQNVLPLPPTPGRAVVLPVQALWATFVLVAALTLSGCASMADASAKVAGLGIVTQEKSTFDNATIVEVSPNWLYDPNGSWGNGVKLGARWTSKAPELAALVLSYSSNTMGNNPVYVGLKGIDVNIDGSISTFSAGKPTNLDSGAYNTVSRTIYTQSENTVVLPYAILMQMVTAKDCRLRIHTSKGHEDALFSTERIPGGQGTAILSFREFVKKVDEIIASR
jgi:hypothetical protein